MSKLPRYDRLPLQPPLHAVSPSTPVSIDAARSTIARYLARTATAPHLHPDAVLASAGVQFSATGGREGGLVLHLLRRLERGMAGERIEGPITGVEEDGGEAKAGKKRGAPAAAGEEDGWMDQEAFEREQEQYNVDGHREDEEQLAHVVKQETADGEGARSTKKAKLDAPADGAATDAKEARKQAKKQRKEQAKKEKAAKAREEAKERAA